MKHILALFLLLFTFVPLNAQAKASVVVADLITPDESDLRKQAFDRVWNTVNERHYDPKFGGVDWAAMRTLYAPQAAAAKTRDDFHNVLRKMLAELKLSHFGIFPRNDELQAARKTIGSTGIEIKIIGGQPVISRVGSDSSAFAAGIKPGFTVQKIDGVSVAEALKKIEESFTGRKLTPGIQNVLRERTLIGLISGKADTTLKLEVIDEKGGVRSYDIARRGFSGEMSQPLGNFPAQEVIFESKRLPSGIGYIRFNMWVIPQVEKIRKALREFSDAKGLIVDLRGNPGGIGGIAPGFAGMLVKEKTSLGSMNLREGEQKFVVYPQENPFLGKVVVVEDYGSASTSEIFISGLQEIGRAKIVGETSAGAVLPSVMELLPTGVTFQYAVSDYRSPKNVLIEGRGVLPDVEVRQTREALLDGRDLPIEAAEKIILN
jgi:carboxyl-terminal processing protease